MTTLRRVDDDEIRARCARISHRTVETREARGTTTFKSKQSCRSDAGGGVA